MVSNRESQEPTELESLKRRLAAHKRNLLKLQEQRATYAAGEEPLHLLNQIEHEEREIEAIWAKLRQLNEAIKVKAHKPEPPLSAPHSWWEIILETPRWKIYAGCLAVVMLFVAVVLTLPFTSTLAHKYLAWLRPPTPTPTPTKTPVTALSPTITDIPTLTPVPSPTPTPTPYYVEIVVDASERMNAEFEGGITKMESAWQTARDIARIRAQQGQFVTIRFFGGQDSLGGGSCLISYSLFDFTNDSRQVIDYLAESPTPAGEAAVATALLDASDELQAYENIGREIILLTGGEDGCGSTLSVFYNSDNQALWTQTFVVLFADEDFGPFINLEAQGANINYDLVRNRAEAETVAEEIANTLPPTATSMPAPTPTPPPTPTTGGGTQPVSTPKPPPPPSIGGGATATRPPTPTTTQSPTPTHTPTYTQTPTKTATNTPTTKPANTPTSKPTATPSPSPSITLTSIPSATPTPTAPPITLTPLPPQNDVYAQNCPLIVQTTGFYKFESNEATISVSLVSGGHTGQGLRLDFTALSLPHSYSGWEVLLGDINNGIDLTPYNSLTFYIRGAAGGETPNVWLMTPIAGGGYRRYYRDVETYKQVTTQWQEVVIPLDHFTRGTLPEEEIDLQHINKIQVVFEWYEEPTSGTINIDDLCVQ